MSDNDIDKDDLDKDDLDKLFEDPDDTLIPEDEDNNEWDPD